MTTAMGIAICWGMISTGITCLGFAVWAVRKGE